MGESKITSVKTVVDPRCPPCHGYSAGTNRSQIIKNKYAIHAYTHGPVTGSGPSVVWHPIG